MIEKFDLAKGVEAQNYYAEHGYVVFSALVPEGEIDQFISVFNNLKGDRLFIFPTQSTYEAVPFVPDAYGHIVESMENPALMALRPKFSHASRRCLLHDNIALGLAALDGHERHVFWQSMFFDKSTGTSVHQDSIYLDTEPRGGLIGAWIALEDIYPESGPFIVYPGTHRLPAFMDENIPANSTINRECKRVVDEQNLIPTEMTVTKGDVVFWHPRLIHGALDNENPDYSRKSFTGHFYPAGSSTIYGDISVLPTTRIAPAFDIHKRNLLVYHFGAYRRWATRKFKGQAAMTAKERKAELEGG